MSPILVSDSTGRRSPLNARVLRPLLGGHVVVRTTSALWRGTLLSCVKDSAWFVIDDVDVVVPLDDLVSVRAA
ncbi:MAG TPA: hypothetical protein VFI47_03065 [Acidimicrobiales bacterium]|nr:hypothetical protein [Acidimicrobiales bacterium]